jgi:CubicO group peptidase (beta-lactamase class C family)
LVCVVAVAVAGTAVGDEWDTVRDVLHNGVNSMSFPGAVALVSDASGLRFGATVGSHVYGSLSPSNPPMSNDTLFDLASLTKVRSAADCPP